MSLPVSDGFVIAPFLTLPADADARRLAFVGMSGSGKTSSAKVVVEHLARAGRRLAVIDPAGVWAGLRVGADGTSPGLPFVVFGGRSGDVPLEASAGAAVADLVMEENLPVILDLSGFEEDADLCRVSEDFVRRLRFLQSPEREPLLLVVDEADLLAPQTARKEQQGSQRALINVARRSRSDGLGLLVITQRPAAITKDILTQAEAVFILRFAGYTDLSAVDDWIGSYLSKEERQSVIAALPSLSEGEAYVTSPSWMRTFTRVQFPLPSTFDSSATPKAGGARPAVQARADVDLSALAERFAEAIREEQENDPEELKKRIVSLQSQLREAPKASADKVVTVEKIVEVEKRVEVPIFREGEVARLSLLSDDMIGLGKDLLAGGQEIRTYIQGAGEIFITPVSVPRPAVPVPEEKPSAPQPPQPSTSSAWNALSVAKRKILSTLAELEGLGMPAATRSHVAVFAGASPTSGAYGKNLTELNAELLLTYPHPGFLTLTVAGRRMTPAPARHLSRRMLHAAWLRRLSAAQQRILRVLLEQYPAASSRVALANRVGASPTSGAYGKNLTELKELGLVQYPRAGQVSATKLLFPAGLS